MPLSVHSYGHHLRGLELFVAGYAFVDLLPVILSATPVFTGLRVRDLADLGLVFVLAAIYVQLGVWAGLWRSRTLRVIFAVLLAMMVQGHSIHLAADSISAASTPGDSGWSLMYFLDERWGHTELHFSFLAIAALFIGWAIPTRADLAGGTASRLEKSGVLILSATYGTLLAGDAVEGQTVALVLPAAIALCLWGLWPLATLRRSASPVVSLYRRFFATSFGFTSIALFTYRVLTGGFPELSTLLSGAG